MSTPSTIELLLLAMHDCGEEKTECYRLARIMRETPNLMQPVPERLVTSVWRTALAQQLMRMGRPSPIAWRVAAQNPNWQVRVRIRALEDN